MTAPEDDDVTAKSRKHLLTKILAQKLVMS